MQWIRSACCYHNFDHNIYPLASMCGALPFGSCLSAFLCLSAFAFRLFFAFRLLPVGFCLFDNRNYRILRSGTRSDSHHYRSDHRNYRILRVRTPTLSVGSPKLSYFAGPNADPIGRSTETIVFCRSDWGGRAERIVFYRVWWIRA